MVHNLDTKLLKDNWERPNGCPRGNLSHQFHPLLFKDRNTWWGG